MRTINTGPRESIRKLTSTGPYTTIAGAGPIGSHGDVGVVVVAGEGGGGADEGDGTMRDTNITTSKLTNNGTIVGGLTITRMMVGALPLGSPLITATCLANGIR